MKVALVLDSFVPGRGGVEQWAVQLTDHLTRRGHRVHVVTFAATLDVASWVARPERLVVHRVPCRTSNRVARAAALADVVRRLDVDVVHDLGAGWQCDVLQPHGGARRASFEQNLLLLPWWLRPLKRLAARFLPRYRQFERLSQRQYGGDSLVLALSKMVQRDLVRWYDVPPERIRLVYNGVDVTRFRPELRGTLGKETRRRLGVRPDETVFLLVAHNFRLKGVPTALQAARRLPKTERWRVVVVGGRRLSGWRRRAARWGLADRVLFVGATTDVRPYYAAADVFVHPTFYDPCSLVVLEALASGLPVVTTRFNGASELLTPGREGLVLSDPRDVPALTEALRSLAEPSRRRGAAVAARELAELHPFEKNVDQIGEVYDEVRVERRRRQVGRAA